MTGKEFAAKMVACDNRDTEMAHCDAADLLVEAMKFLAKKMSDRDNWLDGLDTFSNMPKWYA